MTGKRPPEVDTIIATLRVTSGWMVRDSDREMMLEAANNADRDWSGSCCPVCEEVTCDAGCPLEHARTNLPGGD